MHQAQAMTFIVVVGLLLIVDVLFTHRQLRRAIVEARVDLFAAPVRRVFPVEAGSAVV